ncbi:MAG: hypothetical protein HZB16_02550 [Armatimonadetes bacterium]|nr:hypothetical protein [Armatimonadota bacterium]
MMTLLAFVGLLATICCPLTLPFWVFILFGFHTGVRKEFRRRYVRRHGSPQPFSRDWWMINA